MHDDDKLDDLIAREAKGYRAEGKAPADRMWARIEGEVKAEVQTPRYGGGGKRAYRWVPAGVGIAATLLLGVLIGRRSITRQQSPAAVESAAIVASADSARAALMRAVTLSHLVQAEVFLTEVRADLTTGRRDAQRAGRSRELLARTRLIMADNSTRAPQVEQLLQDLEIVLAGIAALPDSGARPSDTRLGDERRRVASMLPRIRTLLPAPADAGGGL